ncbi:NUDIX hydrolase domain-like protein [Leptodontidium sp. 2 PMI_412]|nr:NUDIX hydrolase domain-like protein [Leptodontidium sp. 2 PMI_412]
MAVPNRVNAISLGQSVNPQILNFSREEFRQHQLSATKQSYDKIVVGAAVLRHASAFHKIPSILLLKRAAHEVYFPSVFKLPGGKVDPDDPTIKHALVREMQEETGLEINNIFTELKPMIYTTEKAVVNDTGREILVSKSCIQLNYVVSVADSDVDVKLNAEEHSESTWVTEGELDSLDITSAMRIVIREAFGWAATKRLG